MCQSIYRFASFFQTHIMSFEVHLTALLSRSEEYSTTKKFKKQTLMNHFAGSRSKPGGLKIEISDIYNFKKKDGDTSYLTNMGVHTYTRAQNVCPVWPVYGVKCLCSRGQE